MGSCVTSQNKKIHSMFINVNEKSKQKQTHINTELRKVDLKTRSELIKNLNNILGEYIFDKFDLFIYYTLDIAEETFRGLTYAGYHVKIAYICHMSEICKSKCGNRCQWRIDTRNLIETTVPIYAYLLLFGTTSESLTDTCNNIKLNWLQKSHLFSLDPITDEQISTYKFAINQKQLLVPVGLPPVQNMIHPSAPPDYG